jgi:hypothetical protein
VLSKKQFNEDFQSWFRKWFLNFVHLLTTILVGLLRFGRRKQSQLPKGLHVRLKDGQSPRKDHSSKSYIVVRAA